MEKNGIINTGIFFITGRPRSGTTLLNKRYLTLIRIFLCLMNALLLLIYFQNTEGLKTWNNKIKESFLEDLYKQPLFNFWNCDAAKLRKELLEQPINMDYSDVCKFIYLQFNSLIPKEKILLIGDKNPGYTIHLRRLSGIFPDAKFIHIIRDCKDQVSSMLNVDFEKPYIPSLAFRWRYFNNIAYKFRKKYPGKIMFVKYEDLVKAPETEANRIFSFLGIPYRENILNFYKEKDIYEKAYSKEYIEKYHKELFQPISARRIGAWKQNMNEKKIEMIEGIAGKGLDKFAYRREFKKAGLKYSRLILAELYMA